MTAKCSACGTENPSVANFCENCGAAIGKASMVVPGKPVLGGQKPLISPQASIQQIPSSQPSPDKTDATLQLAPTTSPSSMPAKNGANVAIIAGVVVLLGAGAFFLLKPSDEIRTSGAAPDAVNPSQPPVAIASKPVEPPPSPPAVVATPESAAPTTVPSQVVTQPDKHIQAMLDGVRANDESVISSAIEAIKQLGVPPRGDRKVARVANEAGLAAEQATAEQGPGV